MAKQTYKDLLKQQEELAKLIEEARKNEIASVVAEIKTQIEEYKLTAEDLGFASKKTAGRKPSATKGEKVVKFRNPENPEQTYSGHGRKPDWLNAKLNQGRKLEEFAVA